MLGHYIKLLFADDLNS